MRWRQPFAVATLLALAGGAAAHDIPGELRVHAIARAQGDQLHVLVRLPLALLLNLDLPKRGSGYLDLAHIDEALARAIAATAKDLEFFAGNARLLPTRGEARISLPADKSFESFETALASIRGPKLPVATDVYWNQGYFDASLEYPLRARQGDLAVDFHVSPGLRDRLRLDLRFVTAEGVLRAFELPTGAGRVALDPRWHQAARTFVRSGFDHILGGIDHLLFLVCLVVPFRRVNWRLVGVVTAFTVAHSITLIAAAHGAVPAGNWFPPLVETLIAVSILYMALENVVRPNLRWRWLVAAAFGLVHGFGFSFALANELQFAGAHLLLSLLAFNVGIELGQLLVLLALWPALVLLLERRLLDERIVVAIISAFVAHAAWHWVTERWQALTTADWSAFDAGAAVRTLAVLLGAIAVFLLLRGWRGGAARRLSPPD
jgi:hypothetical protein